MPKMRDPNTGRYTSPEKIAADIAKAKRIDGNIGAAVELGVSTSRHMGRTLYDDFLPQLRGQRAAKTYREMADNDATIGAILFAIEMFLREVSWHVEPADDSPQAEEWAEFVQQQFDDMTHSWSDHIAAALSFLPFGFAPFEIVYRERTEESGSKYDDGKWGWRKFAFRPQDTIEEIATDETGGLEGIIQSTGAKRVGIPIEKVLLYRTTTQRGPEGRSALRNAYRSWFFKRRAEELVMIGVDRDLAGLPMAKIPAEDIISESATFAAIKRIVTRTKRDEQEGIVWPNDRDEEGNPLYEFELVGTGSGNSARIAQAHMVVRSLSNDMAATVLAGFMGLGRDAVGSRALADPLIEMFATALEAWADVIADTLTRHAVPRLLALNGAPRAIAPTIKHSPVKEIDLGSIGAFIQQTANAGAEWFGVPGDTMMDRVREIAGFDPEPTLDEQNMASDGLMGVDDFIDSVMETDTEASESISDRANAAGMLIRSGFDPVEAARIAGLPPIRHTGLQPVTVKEPNE